MALGAINPAGGTASPGKFTKLGALAGPVGAGIGAGADILGGIFGAVGARRQEERALQFGQQEEQRRQFETDRQFQERRQESLRSFGFSGINFLNEQLQGAQKNAQRFSLGRDLLR